MIDLTDVAFQTMEPQLPDYGVLQRPVIAGAAFKIHRLGGGFTIVAKLPPMRMEPDGRRLIARLQQARTDLVRIGYVQVDFNLRSPGDPTVDGAHAGGTTLAIAGAEPHYAVRQGQALNVVKGGVSYLYFAAAETLLDGDGDGDLLLTRPLRTMLAGGEDVNLRAPVVEGWITSDLSWPIDIERTTGLGFTVEERG